MMTLPEACDTLAARYPGAYIDVQAGASCGTDGKRVNRFTVYVGFRTDSGTPIEFRGPSLPELVQLAMGQGFTTDAAINAATEGMVTNGA